MAEREDYPEVFQILKSLNSEALLTSITDGVEEDEVDWVTPKRLKESALKLRELVLANDSRIKPVLDSYAVNANDEEPIAKEFTQDLSDVAGIADFFEKEGVSQMTLEVNW